MFFARAIEIGGIDGGIDKIVMLAVGKGEEPAPELAWIGRPLPMPGPPRRKQTFRPSKRAASVCDR